MSSTQHKMNVHSESLKHEADETFYNKYHSMSQKERLSKVDPTPLFSLLVERNAPQTKFILKIPQPDKTINYECFTSLYDAMEAQEQMGGTIHRYQQPNKFGSGDAAFAEALKKEQAKSYFDISFLNDDETSAEESRRLCWERRVYPQHTEMFRDDFVDAMFYYKSMVRQQILSPSDGRAKEIKRVEKELRKILTARQMKKVLEEAIYQAAALEGDNPDPKRLKEQWALLAVCMYNKAVETHQA